MMHPAPIRAPSRTWDWFQMLVPSPICASGATSAVGWMRTDGRSFMRSPAVPRFYAAPHDRLGSSRGAGQRSNARGGGGDRLPTMAEAVLLLRRQLRGGEARRELEDRVIPESRTAATPSRYAALDGAGEELHGRLPRAGFRERQPADHPRPAISDPFEAVEQRVRVVPRLRAPPARRSGPRAPIEGRHLDPGVVRQRQAA